MLGELSQEVKETLKEEDESKLMECEFPFTFLQVCRSVIITFLVLFTF